MNKQPEALRLADLQNAGYYKEWRATASELRRLHHNNEVLLNALWKACGDNKTVVNNTIKSQGTLK
jgi:hypothetical protein